MSVCLGAFALPVIGGFLSTDAISIPVDSNPIQVVLSGSQAPFLTHSFVFLLFLFPILSALTQRKVVHVPNIRISLWLAIFGAFVVSSLSFSSFWLNSLMGVLQWIMMTAAYFAVCINGGKKQSIWVVSSLFAGMCVAAIFGILEYGQMRLEDPGHRILALQAGPNQAGALFASGVLLGFPLMFRFDRLGKMGVFAGIVLQGLALVLTQSKGAIFCVPVGLAVLVISFLILKPVKPAITLVGICLPFLLIGVMSFGIQQAAKQKEGGGSAPMARFANSSESSTQSAGFRKLLWLSAVDLIKQRPLGWGINTFGFESTRPGRSTQTGLAHQTFLQLGSEASLVAPVALLGFFIALVYRGLRGIKNASQETQLLLIGSISALAVAIAHNFIDSDMYYFGLGTMVFVLVGSITSASTDSQAPEVIFKVPKFAVVCLSCVLIPICLLIGSAEYFRASARGAIEKSNLSLATENVNRALSLVYIDGSSHAILGLLQQNEAELKRATEFSPTPKNFRALASNYLRNNKSAEAFKALKSALERDPLNAQAMWLLVTASEAVGDESTAIQYANRLIESENTTYFQVRSLAEFVPLQTYEARLFLAKKELDPVKKAKLLSEAVRGFAEYSKLTVPVIVRFSKVGLVYGGDDPKSATNKLQTGKAAAEEFQRLRVTVEGFDPAGAITAFEAALELLKSQ
jgi:O-antigen ligase